MTRVILDTLNIEPLFNAQTFLKSAIKDARSPLEKAGAILSFEICYELAWKTMKRILAYRGILANSPREVFRLSAQENLISDLDDWFQHIEKRNLTTHVYNPEIAEEVFNYLPLFAQDLNQFIAKIKDM